MLTPEEQRRAEEIFELALDLSAAERDALIAEKCSAAAPVAAEVRMLLKHFEAAPPDFMQTPAVADADFQPPETIGPYKLCEVLGEGGMGVVYRAEQSSPVVRSVALKILKLGMDSREILARFDTERQVLASLEHPNIARVYDAGVTVAGRPYFVMEHIQGSAITTYCDERKLLVRERLELFAALCRGVQFAHQKGIIHRDLKPMNILVGEVDGIARPKVIDFGVAKAVQPDLAVETFFTSHGQLIGTPEYMSPEQVESAPVDTRSDIYSLGVILYELLAGVLPLDAKTLREAGFYAMMKMIREQDPASPSTRVSTLAKTDTSIAECRNVEPRVLARTLRGDLDWIVLKALNKNPDRRYDTVTELAADLDRFLANQPIKARPASLSYSLAKFVRRHRLGVGLALTIVVALGALGVNIIVQSQRVARERDRANHEAAVSGQVKDFLVDIFKVSDPSEARGNSVSAREILDRGAAKVRALPDGSSRAEMMWTLATVYENLALYDQSDSLYVAAMEIWLEYEGLVHERTLASISAVAGVYKATGRLAEAESLFTVAVDGWRALESAEEINALDSQARLASVIRRQGRYAEAESLYVLTIAQMIPLVGADDAEVLQVRGNLGFCYMAQRDYVQAAAIYEDVLRRQRRSFGDDSPRTLETMSQLGFTYSMLDRLDEAEAILTEGRTGIERVLGREHPKYAKVLESLGNLYFRQEELIKAELLFTEVLELRRNKLGAEHPSVLVGMHNLAEIQNANGKHDSAEKLATETLAIRIRLRGEGHSYTQETHMLVAKILAQQGAYDEALVHLQTAAENGLATDMAVESLQLAVFDPLRSDPRFAAVVASMMQR